MHYMWKRKSVVAGAAALGALVVAACSIPAPQTRAEGEADQIFIEGVQISPENFKDAKFREVLKKYDSNSDGYLQEDEIGLIQDLKLANSGIKDLTGIEYLIALEQLDCSGCEITELNLVAGNSLLWKLNCSGTKLTKLDLQFCPNVEELNCKGAPVTSIKFGQTEKLRKLNCAECKLTELAIPEFGWLEELICYGNELKTLSISQAQALDYLDCSNNPLESLDIIDCQELTTLYCRETSLTKLVLSDENVPSLENFYVSDNAELTALTCDNTHLSTISLQGCKKLKTLELYYNELTELNLKEQTALVELNCGQNKIKSLDLSVCPNLTVLECQGNPIESLDLSKTPLLKKVYCFETKLTSIDVSTLTALEDLQCDDTEISSIDVSKNTKLKTLYTGSTKIKEIDISMLPDLEIISVRNTDVTKLDISKNLKLKVVSIGDTKIKDIDLSEHYAIETLWIENTGISDLDLADFENLTDLDVSGTKVQGLDLCQNKKLETLACSNLDMYSLQLNFTPNLTYLDIGGTKITGLNIYGCTALEKLVNEHEPKEEDGKYYVYEDETGDGYFFLRCNKDTNLTSVPYPTPSPMPPVTIPNVVGMKCDEAKATLKKELKSHGFCHVEIKVELDKDADASKDLYVISQTPEAGKVFYGNHSRFGATLVVANEVPGTTPTPTPEPNDPTFEDFVERLYTVALNRPSEKEGKDFWVKQVVEEGKSGADCARFFLLDADEFMKRNLSVEDFVETLYKTFFDRESDAEGKKGWVDAINTGKMTRAVVVNNFIESTEWCNVCATYGVKSGAKYYKATKASKNAINFATRLYTCCLKREAEEGGLKYWSLALTNLEKTGAQAAQFFFEGEEFVGFNTTDQDYITRLYTTFMDREPAPSEVEYWIGEIKAGRQTRKSVISFFAQSPEFTSICKKYGIDRGTI